MSDRLNRRARRAATKAAPAPEGPRELHEEDVERRELSPLAREHMGTLLARHAAEKEHAAQLIAADMKLKLEDGWKFIEPLMCFLREKPKKGPAGKKPAAPPPSK